MARRTGWSQTLVSVLTLCEQFAAEGLRLDVVREGELPVDLDRGDQLAVAGFERGISGDVDLLELELELGPKLGQLGPRLLAEVAAVGAVERDPRRRYG